MDRRLKIAAVSASAVVGLLILHRLPRPVQVTIVAALAAAAGRRAWSYIHSPA